ncbi:SurA N-terminal domain-containing protein [Patescibacteria group bacterium]|nr:SurA N-terminal domain-containing protein [Patescibacteria group bacterium]
MGKYIKILEKKTSRFRALIVKDKKRTVTIAALVLGIAITGYFLYKNLIVAWVNGSPITRFEVIKLLERQGGRQALDNLITRKLISQEARALNISISQEEINVEIDELKSTLEESGTSLEDALALQGQNLGGLTQDIKLQKLVEKILAENIAVSDEETSKYFEENRDFFDEDATIEEVSDQIKEQLKQEKLTTAFNDLLAELRGGASVKINLNY